MRACIYNRCSTEEESQMNALEIQAQESREIVERKGWIVVGQYVESQSGTTSYRRSEYQRMLEDLEQDLFDVVVVKSIDRLTRSAKDWYIFLDKLTLNQKKLYLYIDRKFYTPDDNLLTGIKAILAEDFSRELSKKIKNAHRRRQEKQTGLNITVPIFGWDKVSKDVYVLNEEEADAYRLAFGMAEDGKGFYTIAKQMYERGVRSKRGGRISEVQWRKMLHSPRAHGAVILHTTEYDFETKQKRKVPEEEWIVIEDALPAIVSKEYQKKVLEMLQKRTAKNQFSDYTRNMTKGGLYALSGKIYCSECGKPYYRSKAVVQKEKVTAWKCSTFLKQGREHGCRNITVLEADVLKTIEKEYGGDENRYLQQRENLTAEALCILQKVFSEDEAQKTIHKLEKQLVKLEKKKSVLLEKLLNEVIEDEEYLVLNREMQEQIEALHIEVQSMKEKRDEYINYKERLQKIKQLLDEEVVRQALVRAVLTEVKRILVYPDGRLQILFQ